MLLFWERGYEGAGLADLTAAMGISRKSLDAAFGSKDELFCRALARYTEGPGAYTARALEKPTAREVAAAFLREPVHATTRPGSPAGCLVVQGALAPSGADAPRERLPRRSTSSHGRLVPAPRIATVEGTTSAPVRSPCAEDGQSRSMRCIGMSPQVSPVLTLSARFRKPRRR